MAYQSNAMIKSIFRSKIWLIIYLILLFISYYNIGMNTSLQIKRVHMLRILGIIYDNDFLGTLSLFFLYQLFITLFMIHLYFIFENEHSAEYTLCRISRKKLILLKTIFSFFLVIIFRLIHFMIIYQFFFKFVDFTAKDFILNIVEYLGLWFVYVIIYIFVSLRKLKENVT